MGARTTIRLDGALSDRDGRLFIEDCDVAELARRFGTPLYVTSEDALRRNLDSLGRTFGARWPGPVRVLPSIKANAALAVRRALTAAGAGADVFGPAELEAALRGGVEPGQISLNGPTKNRELLARAVGLGVRVTLDSVQELTDVAEVAGELGREALVRLRLRPDYVGLDGPSGLIPSAGSVRGAAAVYKAGIPTDDLLALSPPELAPRGVRITGVMVHLGRHDAVPATWQGMAAGVIAVLRRLLAHHPGLPLDELDIGGGLPTPRDPFGRAAQAAADDPFARRTAPLDAFADAILPVLADGLADLGRDPSRTILELEPGRALFADAGIHLTRVLAIKRDGAAGRAWVQTDTSDAWLPDVVLEGNRWSAVPARHPRALRTWRADVVGTSCAPDILISDEWLPELKPGEILAVLDTGAYQEAAASNFNSLPRPASVLVAADRAELIRRAETIDDVFARDIVPPRLGGRGTDPVEPSELSDSGRGDGPRLLGVHHVSVAVADLERALRFYGDLLGLPVRERGEEAGGDVSAITGLGAVVRWADLSIPGGHVLELLEYRAPVGRPHRPQPNDPGATHVGLRVGDADAVHDRLAAAGHVPIGRPVTLQGSPHWEGARCFYVRDPDGVVVEIVEAGPRPPGG